MLDLFHDNDREPSEISVSIINLDITIDEARNVTKIIKGNKAPSLNKIYCELIKLIELKHKNDNTTIQQTIFPIRMHMFGLEVIHRRYREA